MDSTGGLRERKKAETRQAVHEAALRLVAEHGLEAVTVEAIADAANISRRTFSNYFTGKEDAVLYGEERRIRHLVDKVRAQPAERPAWQALRGAIKDVFDEVGDPSREWAVRARLAKQHPSLLARQLANHAALERDLAQAISERESRVRARVMAAGFLTALRLGSHLWVEERQERSLREVTNEMLDEMAKPFD